MADEQLPDDPFPSGVPDWVDFSTVPNADELREFLEEFASAKLDYSALLHQQTFRKLRAAVWALYEGRARAVLLRAVATSIALNMNDQARFKQWAEAE
jgi:hypothetical protein